MPCSLLTSSSSQHQDTTTRSYRPYTSPVPPSKYIFIIPITANQSLNNISTMPAHLMPTLPPAPKRQAPASFTDDLARLKATASQTYASRLIKKVSNSARSNQAGYDSKAGYASLNAHAEKQADRRQSHLKTETLVTSYAWR